PSRPILPFSRRLATIIARRGARSHGRAYRRIAAPAAAGRDVAGERGLGLGARRAVLARAHTHGGLDSRECWRRAPGGIKRPARRSLPCVCDRDRKSTRL